MGKSVFQERLESIVEAVKADAVTVKQYGQDLLPRIREQKQGELRQQYIVSATADLQRLETDLQTKLKQVKAEVTRERFPAFSSSVTLDHIFGSSEFTASRSVADLAPVDLVDQSYMLGRVDFISFLRDRLETAPVAVSEDEIKRRHQFVQAVDAVMGKKLAGLVDEEKALTALLERVQIFTKNIQTVDPGPFTDNVLTMVDLQASVPAPYLGS